MTEPQDPSSEEPRRPLRPLAQVLRAREEGQNPDLIERANRIRRHETIRDKLRVRAESRLIVLSVFFIALFGAIGGRMAQLATSTPAETESTWHAPAINSARADIVDRNGNLLATNIQTEALYAHPQDMVDIPYAVKQLVKIFPDLDGPRLLHQLTRPGAKFVWIRKTMSPEEEQRVFEIGDPGLLFAGREMRLYPNGRLAAHVLGGASFGEEGVNAAEVIGVAGIEKFEDQRLRDPAMVDTPLQLSIDVTIQAAMRKVLQAGIGIMDAKGGSAVLMDVTNGQILGLTSLPDFDPNDRPAPLLKGDPSDSPLFNRAVLGVYELGSVFKVFDIAQALQLGLVTPDTPIDTRSPLVYGRFRIHDDEKLPPSLSVTNVLVNSSNIGAAHIAQMIGATRQEQFMDSLGLLKPTPLELVEAATGRPIIPQRWVELTAMTIGFGHGLSISQVHLAAAYCAMVNGGLRVEPTLLKQDGPKYGPRVISEKVSHQMVGMMRKVVTNGTASFGDVPGYDVAGKTGSAEKARPGGGGYMKNKNLTTFASTFPASNPRYVLVVTLDQGHTFIAGMDRRTSGWVTVPVAREMIRRVAPLLGMRPAVDGGSKVALQQAGTKGSNTD